MYNPAIKKISDEDIYYFRERNRNRVYAAVMGVFSKLVEKEDLTKREIAFRLGKEPSQITRWLSGPSNWTLDTFSDLLIAMGAELDHSVSMINEKAASTVRHPLMQTHVCEVIELKSPNASVGESHASTNMDFSYEVKAG